MPNDTKNRLIDGVLLIMMAALMASGIFLSNRPDIVTKLVGQ